MDRNLMNGLQALEQWQEYFGNPQGAMLGLVNAAQSIGSVLALPIVGSFSDRYGRKLVLLAGIIGVIVATIIQATATTLAQFVVSRLVVGFAGMFVVQPAPMLIAELAYPTHRGKYTSAYWTMYYLGAILASWTTFGTEAYESDWSWRIPTILQAGYPLVQLAFLYWVPESPRWLVSKERNGEAFEILAKYHAAGDTQSPLVVREMGEIAETIRMEQLAQATGWGTLIQTPGNRKRLFIAVCLGAFAQWNGIGVVSYYLTLVLDSVGITSSYDQTLINGGLQIFNFIAAVSAAFLVDRLGRRTLFNWSNIGMLISYIVWTACSAVNNEEGSKAAGIVVIVCLFTFYFHYDIAYTPLLLGYTTEILPFGIRSKGLSCELMSIYVSLVIAAFCNPIGMENLGWKYYIVFCCLLVLFTVVVWFTFPETRGHSLEEIAEVFDGQPIPDTEETERKFSKGGYEERVEFRPDGASA
ncbi:general substrate transporter [Hortaea werneckii]|nr:general substrate transporter [Hortaea werneckii]